MFHYQSMQSPVVLHCKIPVNSLGGSLCMLVPPIMWLVRPAQHMEHLREAHTLNFCF